MILYIAILAILLVIFRNSKGFLWTLLTLHVGVAFMLFALGGV